VGRIFWITSLVLALAATASPSALTQELSGEVAPGKAFDLGFDGLTNGAAFKTYTAHGFTVQRANPGWIVYGDFGNPAPMIGFNVPANTIVSKAVTVTEAGKQFALDSIDIYSSLAPVNWEFVGKLAGQTLYKDKGQAPNPMGGFATVPNPDATTPVDSVEIKLTSVQTPCCENSMGLDNIIVEK